MNKVFKKLQKEPHHSFSTLLVLFIVIDVKIP